MVAICQKKKSTLIMKIYIFENLLCKISLILFTIKKPPDEIIVNERLNASKDLRLMIL